MAFENYWKEKIAYDEANKKEMVKIIPQEMPAFNKSILLKSIYDISNMSDVDLRKFVQKSFRLILNNIFFGSNINEVNDYVNCFRDARFLDAFVDVISVQQFFEKDDIVKMNTICYNYIKLNKSERDPIIVSKMMRLASLINRTELPRLLGLGLSDNLANMLLIARHSDLNLDICVKRVDFIIITQPKELMSQKMIEQILQTLYNVLQDWPRIFPYIMYDVLQDYNELDPLTHWITDDIQEVDSTLSLAVLSILENLPAEIIRRTLVNYSEGYSILNKNKPIRFSMQRLSDDFCRVNDTIDKLRNQEDIIVP